MTTKLKMIYATCSAALMVLLSPLSGIAMTFEDQGSGGNCDTCVWVAASGEITSSTAIEFRSFASNHDKYTTIIYLSSPGGSVAAAMQLGREFRNLGMTTVIGESIKTPGERFPEIRPGAYVSACVLAFAGGKSRYYRSKFGFEYGADKNLLGLHQFYTDACPEERNMTAQAAKAFGMESAQMAMGVEMAYLAEMGVDPLLLTLANATKRGDIYTLTEAEALHFKLAIPQDLQPDWQLKFYKQALAAEGHGSFEGAEYDVALWCPDHLKRQLFLRLKINAGIDFGEDRVRPFQHYIRNAELLSSDYSRFPISFREFDRNGASVVLTFSVDGTALAVLQSGRKFRLDSDAGHANWIIPWGTMRLDPLIVPTLLKTCEL